MKLRNVYENTEPPETGEHFEDLFQHRNLKIERIVSSAEVTPHIYDQEQDEWVMLLQGKASLRVDGKLVELGRGDNVFLPAHTPHEVLSVEKGTVWLAVHLFPEESSEK